MNVDNNIEYLTPYPVIFTPTNQGEIFKDRNEFFLDLLMEMRTDIENVRKNYSC